MIYDEDHIYKEKYDYNQLYFIDCIEVSQTFIEFNLLCILKKLLLFI